jgi:hypothetical protein
MSRVVTRTFTFLATLWFHFVLPAKLCFQETFEAQETPAERKGDVDPGGQVMVPDAAKLWVK